MTSSEQGHQPMKERLEYFREQTSEKLNEVIKESGLAPASDRVSAALGDFALQMKSLQERLMAEFEREDNEQ